MKMPKFTFKVRGMRVARFYKDKWQQARHYRFKNKPENIVSVVRDILIRNGYKFNRDIDYDLGQAYLMVEGKIKGFIPRSLNKFRKGKR